MESLRHPELGETVSVPPSLARKLRARGWMSADLASDDEARYYLAAAGALTPADVRAHEALHLCDFEGCDRTFATERGLSLHSRVHEGS